MYEIGDLVVIKKSSKLNYTPLLQRASKSVGIVLDAVQYVDYSMYLVHFPSLAYIIHFYSEELEPLT